MSEHHAPSKPSLQGLAAHQTTYDGFIKGSVALSMICVYILVALVVFRFMNNPLNVITGFGGLLLGIITTLIALRMGGRWTLPAIVLVLFAVFAAANVHMS